VAKLLRPSLDFVFKGIFGTEENKDEVLLHFINEAVRETEPKLFVSLTQKFRIHDLQGERRIGFVQNPRNSG
jgi:hypothetical protein